MRTCAIMQPTYLPWLGYFDLIRKADVFVIYDSVQFEKQSWQQRNRIRNKNEEIMLTISVKYGKGIERKINEVEIDNKQQIFKKHLTSIKLSYARSKNYNLIIEQIEAIYNSNYFFLIELNVALIKLGMNLFKLDTEMVYSSELSPEGSKVSALIDICTKLNVNHYYSPIGSKNYIDENNLFEKTDIKLSYQNFVHPVYQQLNYPNFISHLSFIDYLFNCDNFNIFKR
jgi:WbqC-like protein